MLPEQFAEANRDVDLPNVGEVSCGVKGAHRNHTHSGRPEHRQRQVRIGWVQLALYKIG
jgi:hypothetical protein